MTAIWYDEDCECLWIEGAAQAFAARTLRATRDGDMIGVRLKLRSENILWQPYTQLTDRAGLGFLSAAEAKAYLDGEFAKKPPIRGTLVAYPLRGAASFAIAHGLAYVPCTTIIDGNGVEIDTDVAHSPGLTTLTFASPFTGTLYLG